jgi:hypothetical protein
MSTSNSTQGNEVQFSDVKRVSCSYLSPANSISAGTGIKNMNYHGHSPMSTPTPNITKKIKLTPMERWSYGVGHILNDLVKYKTKINFNFKFSIFIFQI